MAQLLYGVNALFPHGAISPIPNLPMAKLGTGSMVTWRYFPMAKLGKSAMGEISLFTTCLTHSLTRRSVTHSMVK